MIKNLLIYCALSSSLVSSLHATTHSFQEEIDIQKGATCALVLAQQTNSKWYDHCLQNILPHLQPQHRIDRVLASLAMLQVPLHFAVFDHDPENVHRKRQDLIESLTQHQPGLCTVDFYPHPVNSVEELDRDSKQHFALVLLIYRHLAKNGTLSLTDALEDQIEQFLMGESSVAILGKTINNSLRFTPAKTSLCSLFKVEESDVHTTIMQAFEAQRVHVLSEHHEEDVDEAAGSISDSSHEEASLVPEGSTNTPRFSRKARTRQSVEKIRKPASQPPSAASSQLQMNPAESATPPMPTPRRKVSLTALLNSKSNAIPTANAASRKVAPVPTPRPLRAAPQPHRTTPGELLATPAPHKHQPQSSVVATPRGPKPLVPPKPQSLAKTTPMRSGFSQIAAREGTPMHQPTDLLDTPSPQRAVRDLRQIFEEEAHKHLTKSKLESNV